MEKRDVRYDPIELDEVEEHFRCLDLLAEPEPPGSVLAASLSVGTLENWIQEDPIEAQLYFLKTEQYQMRVRRAVNILRTRPESRARLKRILELVESEASASL